MGPSRIQFNGIDASPSANQQTGLSIHSQKKSNIKEFQPGNVTEKTPCSYSPTLSDRQKAGVDGLHLYSFTRRLLFSLHGVKLNDDIVTCMSEHGLKYPLAPYIFTPPPPSSSPPHLHPVFKFLYEHVSSHEHEFMLIR